MVINSLNNMINLVKFMYFKKLYVFFLFCTLILTQSCGGFFKMTDAREVSPNPNERVKKNMEEGRGLRIGAGKKGGEFQFASSNPLWRASLDILDFAPLLNANYSGGIIITDWISTDDENSNEFYKITVKFLSNEIRPDGIDIALHQKNCNSNNICKISKIQSSLSDDLALEILKRAARYQKEDAKKITEELGEYKVQPAFNTGKKKKK